MCKQSFGGRSRPACCTCLSLNFGEIPMQFGFHKDDSVQEFLDDLILVLVERLGYVSQIDFSLLVDGCLSVRRRSSMLSMTVRPS
jgi:hypothetical protein